MMKADRSCCLALLASLALVATAQAQQDNPHAGYVYPAGGQRGTTFDVIVGGKHLDSPMAARVSGDGVTVKVLEHIRPLNQGQFKELQNRMGELKKKKEAAIPSSSGRRRRGDSEPTTNANWTTEDERQYTEIRRRLATFSIRRSSVPALVETVTLEVTVARDAEPGRRELRLQTEQGVTNPLVFWVGQLPETVEESGRSAALAESQNRGGRGRKQQQAARPDPGTTPTTTEPEAETKITLPTVVNGQILPGDVDRYRFAARKGQQLVVDVSARRLIPYLSDAVPGWFQATVALFDAEGRELAYDDDFRFHPDPMLHCEIPADGEYVIEIRDALYRGREDFVYRVALGELPLVTSIFPLGGRSGAQTTVEISGWNLPQTELIHTAQGPGTDMISVRADRLLSNCVPFATDELPEYSEEEPNNAPGGAQQVMPPLVINGRVDPPGDVDVFCFACRAGGEIVAEIKARRLGSSLDAALKLTDAAGVQLAFNDDHEDKTAGLITHHADPRIRITTPKDGLYYLYVADAQQKGGAEYGYRLYINRQKPDFQLRVVPSSINARAGTNVPITVHVLRSDGFSGGITLTLEDPPPGFTISGGLAPAGQDVIRATLAVPSEAPKKPCALVLQGRAIIGTRGVTRRAIPADDMMQAFIYRHLVPAEELQVAVIGTPRSSAVELLRSAPVRIPMGGTASVPVRVPGRSFFGTYQFELSDPPDGITIENVSLDRSKSEIVLKCDAKTAKPGLTGNLIVSVYAAKTGEDSGKGKEQRKKRRILMGTLPAIPFEVVAD